MNHPESSKRIAVLIDADNAQYSKIKLILDELSAHGYIVTKRAYGDWSSELLKGWRTILNELAIQPIQQFAYTNGKNSTDVLMIIDAMDLLYEQKYDAFALISSDSDFTRLASRLRESEKTVFGVGEQKTPQAFRNACDTFILTENLHAEPDIAFTFNEQDPDSADSKLSAIATEKNSIKSKAKSENVTPPSANNPLATKALCRLLLSAAEHHQEENGWTNACSAISYIKRTMPDFDPRTYGVKNFPDLLQRLTARFDVERMPGKGTVMNWMYRAKQARKQSHAA